MNAVAFAISKPFSIGSCKAAFIVLANLANSSSDTLVYCFLNSLIRALVATLLSPSGVSSNSLSALIFFVALIKACLTCGSAIPRSLAANAGIPPNIVLITSPAVAPIVVSVVVLPKEISPFSPNCNPVEKANGVNKAAAAPYLISLRYFCLNLSSTYLNLLEYLARVALTTPLPSLVKNKLGIANK